MRRFLLGLVALGLVLGLPFGMKTAYAHGGQYRGPAGEVPPDSRQPEDPPPPDSGGGTPTPPDGGGGTPTPPDGGGGTPTPPDGGDPPPPPPPPGGEMPGPTISGGTKTGGKAPRKTGPSYESWLFWWNYNKDEIVNIKKRIRSGPSVSSGNIGVVLDSGGRNESQAQNVTARTIEQQVVPMLEEYARNSKVNFDIQSAAVLSLAKIGRKDQVPLMMEMARNSGADQYHKVVEESAALALGIMQDRSPEVRAFLAKVATDGAAKTRTRCFAAFGLGLLGDRDAAAGANAETLSVLKSMVLADESSKDIGNAALIATGLLGDRAAISDLLKWLNEEKAGGNKLNDLSLSYVAAALGKIGQPGLAGPESREVVDALRDQLKRKNRLTRYATVIAFGQVAPQGDEKVQRDCVAILSDIVKSEGRGAMDTQAVNFALTSLGRIAGVPAAADGTGGTPAAVRTRALQALVEAFDGKGTSKSFAALGLGLAGMELNEQAKQPIAETIRNQLARESGDIERRGAMVISLGMLRDVGSVPMLVRMLEDSGMDKKLRGTAAVALGLIGDRSSSLEPVRKALMEKSDRDLRVDTAIAAGLLGDREVTPTLVEILQDPKSSQFILGSVAMALGQIGDQRAVEPLARILKDEKGEYPDLTRALAAVALGQIGDKNDIPVLSRVSRDVNYRASFDAIAELLTII